VLTKWTFMISGAVKRSAIVRLGYPGACLLLGFLNYCTSPALADACPKPSDEIETDRPDITNSSRVVPQGSLQLENGINVATPENSLVLDGTNTRARLGIAPCLEVLVDVPSYSATLSGRAPSGATDVAPAVKWQIGPMPGKFDLSAVAGIGLPTGSKALVGSGPQPYVQFPWSWDVTSRWTVNGMLTTFFHPSDPVSKQTYESTLVLERKVGEMAAVFIEWVGDFPSDAGARHLLNSGGIYRLSKTEQIDFRIGAGLNKDAPSFVFGLGYSYRFDRLY
jgi:hypothetical protein